MRIQLFICCHPHELLQGSAANSIVRGEETRNQLQKLGTEQGICFGPAHFRGGSHKNETAKVVLPIVADVVTDDEPPLKPACQDGLVQLQNADYPVDIICPVLVLLKSCRISRLVGETMPPHGPAYPME